MSGEETGLGRAITERVRPRLTLADRRGRHARPGQLTRSTVSFGMRIGLSTQNRREYDHAIGTDAQRVRPPIDYWPWPDTGEQAVELRRTSSVVTPIAQPTAASSPAPASAANLRAKPVTAAEVKAWSKADELRRMLTGKGFASFDGLRAPDTAAPVRRTVATAPAGEPAASSHEPTVAASASPASPVSSSVTPARTAAVRRGLPLTPRRRGGTWAGPRTSPGGMATGAAPSATASVAPPRHTTLAPEPLPDVARTGVVDTPSATDSTSPTGARAAAAPTVSAAEMARRLLGEPTPPPRAAARDAARPAEAAASRPGGALGRALAAAQAADAPTAAPTTPPGGAVRRAPATARPSITADALRRTLAPTPAPSASPAASPAPSSSSAPTSAASPPAAAPRTSAPARSPELGPRAGAATAPTASAGAPSSAAGTTPAAPLGSVAGRTGDAPNAAPIARSIDQPTARRGDDGGAPTLPGTAPAGSLPVAVNRLAGVVPTVTAAETLPAARETLLRGSGTSAAVGVLERSSPAEALVESEWMEHSAVLPPRIARSWVDNEAAAEPTPLPLASLPRARRIARGASASAPAQPRSLAPSVAIDRPAEPGTSTESTESTGSTESTAIRRHTALRTSAPAAARLHVARRVISRSADGRHLRWSGTQAAALDVDEPVGGEVLRRPGPRAATPAGTAPNETAPDDTAPDDTAPGDTGSIRPSPAVDDRIDQRTLETIFAGTAAAADSAEGVRGAEDHILRRTLLAANEIAATLGDLPVAPPPVGPPGMVTDEFDDRPAAPAATPAPRTERTPAVPRAAAPPRRGAAAPGTVPSVAHWVPAGPGTLFATTPTGGATVRRALLTMPEMLRSATASIESDVLKGAAARPVRARQDRRTAIRRNVSAAAPAPAPAPSVEASDAPAADAPLVDAGSLAVAPRAVQRLDGTDFADAAPDAVGGGASGAVSAAAAPLDAAPLAAAPLAAVRRSRPNLDAPGTVPPRPAAPAELAERFLTELARHRQERPKPLPVQFASIADLIVGKRRPLVSTSEASQRALAAVDKVAATTGDVIHLAAPEALRRPTREVTGIIAHELTHVAAPSPAPRFFADDRHSAEERRATEIGEIMRRSPAPPPAGSIASRGGTTPMTITEHHVRTPGTGAVTSTSTSTTGGSSGGSGGARADLIRRAMDSSAPAAPQIQRELTTTSTSNSTSSSSGSSSSSSSSFNSSGVGQDVISSEQFSRLLREHFDLIVELLEDRIGSDIERRGGRYRGSF